MITGVVLDVEMSSEIDQAASRGYIQSNSTRNCPGDSGCRLVSLVEQLPIPEFGPGGQRQRLTVNNSTLLVSNDSKSESKPRDSPDSVPGLGIQQNSPFVAA